MSVSSTTKTSRAGVAECRSYASMHTWRFRTHTTWALETRSNFRSNVSARRRRTRTTPDGPTPRARPVARVRRTHRTKHSTPSRGWIRPSFVDSIRVREAFFTQTIFRSLFDLCSLIRKRKTQRGRDGVARGTAWKSSIKHVRIGFILTTTLNVCVYVFPFVG